jgi:hypothetical protein
MNKKSLSNHSDISAGFWDILHLWKGINYETRRGSIVDNRPYTNKFHLCPK